MATRRRSPPLTPEEALRIIQSAMRLNQVRYSDHAFFESLPHRRWRHRDVKKAVAETKLVRWQDDREDWVCTGGTDLQGEPLHVVAAIHGWQVDIVTIYGD
jgi:hypothetical protein